MMSDYINLVKLCVGVDSFDQLQAYIDATPGEARGHVTRMWPKLADQVLAGGSLYWVFKGIVLCRQRILRLDEVTGGDGIARCGIVLEPEVTRTAPAPKRPFQGWRYLKPEDAPPDLRKGREGETALPPELSRALAEIGVL